MRFLTSRRPVRDPHGGFHKAAPTPATRAHPRWMRFAAALLAAGPFCAAAQVPRAMTATATTEHVHGRRIEYVLAGHGTPAVIFENGLGGTLDNWR